MHVNLYKNYKIKAFTLAEILITLLIIGVVASIVVPNLINDSQNAEFYAAAKKAFATANQSYKLSVIDNGGGFGNYNISDTSAPITKFNAMKAYLNIIKDCPFNSNALGNCWASTGVGKGLINDCSRFAINRQNDNNSIKTSDGMYWMFYTYSATSAMPFFAIDVNGEKGPNDWGKDTFAFEIHDTVIKPLTYNCSGYLKHNDGTTVIIPAEFQAPFK